MSTKAVLVDFGLSVQMTEDVYLPKDLRGTEVTNCIGVKIVTVLLRIKVMVWKFCGKQQGRGKNDNIE